MGGGELNVRHEELSWGNPILHPVDYKMLLNIHFMKNLKISENLNKNK